MADVTVLGTTNNILNDEDGLHGPYWTSPSIGYIITQDSNADIEVWKTSDSGASWSEQDSGNKPTNSLNASMSVWYDKETPGNSGTIIHIAYVIRSTTAVEYVQFDTSADTYGTIRSVDTLTISALSPDSDISVTVSKSGRVYVAARGDWEQDTENTDHSMRSSSDGFASDNQSEASPYSSDEEVIKLFPGADVDEDDISAVVYDNVNDDLEFWKFDASGNTWGKTAIDTGVLLTGTETRLYKGGFDASVRHSDEHILVAYFTDFDSATGDFKCADITPATPTVTAKTNLHTDIDDSFFPSILINQQNDDVYVSYSGSDTGSESLLANTRCFFKKSDDGMGTWGTQQTYGSLNDDLRITSIGRTIGNSGGRVMPVFYNNDLTDILVNDGNDVAISALIDPVGISETVTLTENITISRSARTTVLSIDETLNLTESIEDVHAGDRFPIISKVTINGITRADFLNVIVERNISENNGTSKFKIKTDNFAGRISDTYSLNDEVVIFADINKDNAVTKIFTGVIEDIQYQGSGLDERLVLSGRDFGAVLQDMTVQPVVYKNRDAGEIAKVIIENNALDVVTTNNVNTNTGVIIEKIGFNHKSIFDSLIQLAKLSNSIFYVDADKDVHFVARDAVSSGLTFDKTNTTDASFRRNDSQIFNKVWVYGDRVLTGATDVGGVGAGSVFDLTDKPSNTRVFVSSTLQQPGGVFEMDNPQTTSGLKYVVDFNEKKIIFVSGLAAGDNVPASGASNVQVDYERKTPILKFVQDGNSIDSFGPKTKVITDLTIKDFSTANDSATKFLSENKDEKIQGDLAIEGILDVTPGETAIANFPFQNINNQTYRILSATYRFNKSNNQSEQVLSVSMNKHIQDFTDTMKDIIIRTQDLEVGPLEGNLTRLEAVTEDVQVERHFELWQKNVNDNFVFHSGKHGRFESVDSRLGIGNLGSTFLISGGDF